MTKTNPNPPSADSNGLSTNWMALKKKLKRQKQELGTDKDTRQRSDRKKRRLKETPLSEHELSHSLKLVKKEFGLEDVVAMDCEMVSVNMNGSKRAIAARVAIVIGVSVPGKSV